MYLSKLTTFVVSMLLVLLLAGCASVTSRPTAETELESVKLKLNWLHGSQFLGFYVAQAEGFYAAEGFDVTVEQLDDPAGIVLMGQQVADGELDFALGARNVQRAQGDGLPLTVIASIYQFGPSAFFARADSGITTPADLAGRTIVVKGPVWEQMLVDLLAREGLALDDVDMVSGGYDMTPFYTGEVEVWAGFLTNEVVRARMEGVELVTLPLYEYGVGQSSMVFYMSQTTLEADPERAERFLRASLQGWAWSVENPEEAVDIMLAMFPEMTAERDFYLASFEASIPLIVSPSARLGEIDCAAWEADELLAGLESVDNVCTTEVFEAVAE